MKNLKKSWNKLLKNRSSRTVMFAGLSIIAAGSIWAVFAIAPHADTSTTASFQAENATKSGNASIISDASAAGGSAVKFNAPSTGGGTCPSAVPNTPDGPDPWGGCWPGPASTGYPHGLPGDTRTPVTLTDYTPPETIRQCGLVLDKKRIKGDILLQTGNGTHNPNTPCITITNSLVEGVVFGESPDHGPIVIKDTEINPGAQYIWWENLGRGNWFAWRVDSHGSEIVLKCGGYCESYDSYVHGGHLTGAYHYNAFGSNGIERADGFFKIEHNWAECGNWETYNPPATDGGCSSDMGFYGDFDPIRNITINRNFLAGLNSAVDHNAGVPYCLQSGHHQGKVYPVPTNMTITNNVFGRGTSNKCGAFGPATDLGPSPTNVWTNNKYSDGVVIPKP